MDSILINDCWISSIKDSRVENLLINGSDHGSIVLLHDKRAVESKTKTFRCQEFWFQNPSFNDIVKEVHFVGSNAFQLVKKIQCCRQ